MIGIEYLKLIYFIISTVFVILQGPFYHSWHGFPKPTTINLKDTLLNTFGSAVGWAAGYYMLFFRFEIIFNKFNPTLADLVLFLIAFYGMTGYLPHMLIDKLKLGK